MDFITSGKGVQSHRFGSAAALWWYSTSERVTLDCLGRLQLLFLVGDREVWIPGLLLSSQRRNRRTRYSEAWGPQVEFSKRQDGEAASLLRPAPDTGTPLSAQATGQALTELPRGAGRGNRTRVPMKGRPAYAWLLVARCIHVLIWNYVLTTLVHFSSRCLVGDNVCFNCQTSMFV